MDDRYHYSSGNRHYDDRHRGGGYNTTRRGNQGGDNNYHHSSHHRNSCGDRGEHHGNGDGRGRPNSDFHGHPPNNNGRNHWRGGEKRGGDSGHLDDAKRTRTGDDASREDYRHVELTKEQREYKERFKNLLAIKENISAMPKIGQ